MLSQRKDYRQRVAESPRLRLDELWRHFMCGQIAKSVAIYKGSSSDFANLDDKLYKEIRRLKYWADLRHARFGVYPDISVSNFLKRQGFSNV